MIYMRRTERTTLRVNKNADAWLCLGAGAAEFYHRFHRGAGEKWQRPFARFSGSFFCWLV
jgi:hypothetical protein